MNEILYLLEFLTLIRSILGIIVIGILIYLIIFRKGYQYFVNLQRMTNRSDDDKEVLSQSPTIGDWGGEKNDSNIGN